MKNKPLNLEAARRAKEVAEVRRRAFEAVLKKALDECDNLILLGTCGGVLVAKVALDPSRVSEITGALGDAAFQFRLESFVKE